MHASTPCTCGQFPNLQVCQTTTTYSSMPRFQLVSQTVIKYPNNTKGFFRVTPDSLISVAQGDIIGIEIPSDKSFPIVCGQKEGAEQLWAQTYFTFNQLSWSVFNHLYDFKSPTTTSNTVCNVMAVYTVPKALEPPQNLVHYSKTNLDEDKYRIVATNPSSSESFPGVIFGKEIDGFQLLHPCVIISTSPSSLCIIEEGVALKFVFSVTSKETDLLLNTTLGSNNDTVSFSSDCPSSVGSGFSCDVLAYNKKYAVWNYMAREELVNLSVQAVVYNKGSQRQFSFLIGSQQRIRNVTMTVSREIAFVGQNLAFASYYTNGTYVKFMYNLSHTNTISTQQSFNYSFSLTGNYSIQVSVYNEINSVTLVKTVTIVNGSGYKSNLEVELPTVVALGAPQDISMSALLYPFTAVYFNKWVNGTQHNEPLLVYNLKSTDQTVTRMMNYAFDSLGTTSFAISISNSENNNTITRVQRVVEVVNAIQQVVVQTNGSKGNCFITGTVTQVEVFYTPTSSLGTVYLSFDYGDQSAIEHVKDTSIVSHAFKTSDVYNMTVIVSNNASTVRTIVEVKVMDVIQGLSLQVPDYTFRGYYTTVTAMLTSGSLVTYTLIDDSSPGNTATQNYNNMGVFYNQAGNYTINVTASNELSSETITHEIVVYETDYFKVSEIISSPYMPLGDVATFEVDVIYKNPASLIYKWEISDGNSYSSVNQRNISHSFTSPGTYSVNLTVSVPSNPRNPVQQSVTEQRTVTIAVVQEIEGLNVVAGSSTLALHKDSNVSTTLTAYFNKGSHYNILWSGDNFQHTSNSKSHEVTFLTYGNFVVSVAVCNPLGCSERNISLHVYEMIEGLHVFINGHNATGGLSYPSETPYEMLINTTKGSSVQYEFNVTIDGALIATENTNIYKCKGRAASENTIDIKAYNPVSVRYLSMLVSIRDVIEGLSLSASPVKQYYAIGDLIQFQSSIENGTLVIYNWMLLFPNGSLYHYNISNDWSYALQEKGSYNLTVEASNDVSAAYGSLEFTVKEIVSAILKLDISSAPYVPMNEKVKFSVSMPLMNQQPSYQWIISRTNFSSIVTTAELEHTFLNTGAYTIQLVAVSGYLIAENHTEIIVESKLQNLEVTLTNVINSKINANETFTIGMIVTGDTSGAVYDVSFGNGDILESVTTNRVQYQYHDSGIYQVNVTVRNNVSSITKALEITVLERISGLYLVNCCSEPIMAGVEKSFSARVNNKGIYYLNKF